MSQRALRSEAIPEPCECFGPSPWPAMLRLHGGRALSRYYFCPRCGSIREDVDRADRSTTVTHFHDLASIHLPADVIQRAVDILTQPAYKQLPLFTDQPASFPGRPQRRTRGRTKKITPSQHQHLDQTTFQL